MPPQWKEEFALQLAGLPSDFPAGWLWGSPLETALAVVIFPPMTKVSLTTAAQPKTATGSQPYPRRPWARLLVLRAQAGAGATLAPPMAAVRQSGAAAADPGALPARVAAASEPTSLREHSVQKLVAEVLVGAVVPQLETLAPRTLDVGQLLASATYKALQQQPRAEASGTRRHYHEAEAPPNATPVVGPMALMHWHSVQQDRQHPR